MATCMMKFRDFLMNIFSLKKKKTYKTCKNILMYSMHAPYSLALSNIHWNLAVAHHTTQTNLSIPNTAVSFI